MSFYRAFRELGTMRQVGMSVGAIPWDKIVAYANYHGFSRTDTDILIRVIENMDANWQNAIRSRSAPSQ
ncbi:phage tail assembly chaperone [Sphingomonas sp. H160509]|uniref:phage tail assembly chaperone n=1 Tax=Sphingomonas sp. H160509 TaxID=2955313 RepID=UPI00406BF910